MTKSNILLFPNKLRITLRDSSTREPISGVVVTLVIFCKHKNNYYLGLPLSDLNGNIEITKEWVERAINYLRNTFIMDYSSTLEDCLPQIMLDVMSNDQIERAQSAMKLHGAEQGGPDIAFTIIDLERVNNKYFEHHEGYVILDADGVSNKDIDINLSGIS